VLTSLIAICTGVGKVVTEADLAAESGVLPQRMLLQDRCRLILARSQLLLALYALLDIKMLEASLKLGSKRNPVSAAFGSVRSKGAPVGCDPSLRSILLNPCQPSASLVWKVTAGVLIRSVLTTSKHAKDEDTQALFSPFELGFAISHVWANGSLSWPRTRGS
jgi:hypothetical protein